MRVRRPWRIRGPQRATDDVRFCDRCASVCDGRCRARERRDAQERAAHQMVPRW